MNDHLEVIRPTGEIEFYQLDNSHGITSIGRAAANDLRLPSMGVAEFAATLDHRNRPYTIMALADDGQVRVNGRALVAHQFTDLQPWDSIELDGFVLVVAPGSNGASAASGPMPVATPISMAAGAAPTLPPASPTVITPAGGAPVAVVPVTPVAGVPVATVPVATVPVAVATGAGFASAEAPVVAVATDAGVVAAAVVAPVATAVPSLGPPLAPLTDPLIYTVLAERTQVVDVQVPAQWLLTVTNASSLVSRFRLRVEGWIDEAWFAFDDNDFNLNERETRTVLLTASAPRNANSVAGAHHFAIIITSDNLPGHMARVPATLVINPFFEYAVEPLQPLEQSIPWRKKSARFTLEVQNRGNSPVHYRIEGSDRENVCRIEFADADRMFLGLREVAIGPAQEVSLPVIVTPQKRRLIGAGGRTYNLTLTTIPLEGSLPPFPSRGELKQFPLLGRWVIVLTALLIVASLLAVFRPRINTVRYTFVDQSGTLVTRLSNADAFAAQSSWTSSLTGLFSGIGGGGDDGGGDGGNGNGDDPAAADAGAEDNANIDISNLDLDEQLVIASGLVDATVRAGQPLTITWDTSYGALVSIGFLGNTESSLVTVDNPASVRRGNYAFVPHPNINDNLQSQGPTLYELRLESWMARLPLIGAALGNVQRPIVVEVIPANAPIITAFDVNTNTTVLGNEVVVSWDVTMPNTGDELLLEQVQGGQVISSTVLNDSAGSITLAPVSNTEFRLVPSSNIWIGAQRPAQASQNVAVLIPTPTPVPTPDIRAFSVEPQEIIAGNNITITYAISGADLSSLRFFGLPQTQLDLEFDSGRAIVAVPSPGPFNVAIVAVAMPDGSSDPEDPAAMRVTAVASRIAVAPTPTPTPTNTLTPTPTPQEPVIEVLALSPNEIVRGDPAEVLLTWNVIGDADQIMISAPDFSITSTQKQSSISVPRDLTRVFVLTVMLNGEPMASKSVELKVNDPPTATPVPPPTDTPVPTETPLPTATGVPNPLIVSFAATSSLPVRKEVDANGNDIFWVDGGAEVIISWEAQNATEVRLTELTAGGGRVLDKRLATDQISVIALGDLTYTMDAFNNPNNEELTGPGSPPRYGQVSRTMSVRLNAAEVFDPPTNVTYSGGNAEDDPVIITWEYNPLQTDRILGFRVYKANAGSSNFVPIANEATLNNTTRTFTDESGQVCSRVYYVVAVYQDLTKPGTDKTVETDAGAETYLTGPCEAVTPTPEAAATPVIVIIATPTP